MYDNLIIFYIKFKLRVVFIFEVGELNEIVTLKKNSSKLNLKKIVMAMNGWWYFKQRMYQWKSAEWSKENNEAISKRGFDQYVFVYMLQEIILSISLEFVAESLINMG